MFWPSSAAPPRALLPCGLALCVIPIVILLAIPASLVIHSLEAGLAILLLVLAALSTRSALAYWRSYSEEVSNKEAALSRLYQTTPVGLAMLDRELRYIRINEHLAAINGFTVEYHIGKSVAQIIPEIAEQAEEPFRRVLETGVPIVGIEFSGATPKAPGVVRYWRESIFPVLGRSGSVEAVAAVVEEITEQKRAEAALVDSARRKDEFLAMLGHELRNPLAPLQTGVDILRHLPIENAVYESTRQAMGRQVTQLSRLVDDLLEGARITRGKVELKRERVDCVALLRGSMPGFYEAAQEAGVELKIDMPSSPAFVSGDAVRLTQVFNNLVDNAIKYTEPGGLVCLTAHAWAQVFSLEVVDNGIGISPDFLPQVFEVFAQSNHANSKGGLGLGLPIVKKMVELHGGTVSISSAGLGQGTKALVTIPLNEFKPGSQAQSSTSVIMPSRVLLVDDNNDALYGLKTLLQIQGCEVFTASDAGSALQMSYGLDTDVAILDIGLPDMDGYELVQKLKQLPNMRRSRFVALTGYGQDHDRERALACGFDFHLVKPVSFTQLSSVLGSGSPAQGMR